MLQLYFINKVLKEIIKNQTRPRSALSIKYLKKWPPPPPPKKKKKKKRRPHITLSIKYLKK